MEEMKKAQRKRKREFEDIDGLLVFEKRAYFSDYLEAQIGAKWHLIKRSLYDAGYTSIEVNAYRAGLLEDFKAMCKDHGFKEFI